jgi:hypothetical protein
MGLWQAVEFCIVGYMVIIVVADIIGWLFFTWALTPPERLSLGYILSSIAYSILIAPYLWYKILYNSILLMLMNGKLLFDRLVNTRR